MRGAYEILDGKRRGQRWEAAEVEAAVRGAVDGSWDDAQLGAFLMAAATRGLDAGETAALTQAMLASGSQWDLAGDLPTLGDKHSTGGVGDKISLVLGPLLAACGQPVVMLTGRALGHTGGTADKLETIPGVVLGLDRAAALRVLDRCGLAIGLATDAIAPADRKLYALRDATGTVAVAELIVASILSKKLACGAAAIVFDVKTGSGAFLSDAAAAADLATRLCAVTRECGRRASAVLSDMGQPLGRWAGLDVEVAEALDCLAGEGPADVIELTLVLAEELVALTGSTCGRDRLLAALRDGSARRTFEDWAVLQGAAPGWAEGFQPRLGGVQMAVRAVDDGVLAEVDTRELGLVLASAPAPGEPALALETHVRVGETVTAGQRLATLHGPREDTAALRRLEAAYRLAPEAAAPVLVQGRFQDRS